MATLTQNVLSLAELNKRLDPNGNPAKIAEVLARDNEILQDAIWLPSNDKFSNLSTMRLSLPTGSLRGFNEGVAKEVSKTQQNVDIISMIESYSEVDKELADGAPDPRAFRNTEATAFIEGMGQTLASYVFYGNNATNVRCFTGLAPRLDALETGRFARVKGCSGTGSDVTSAYIIQFGEDKVFFTYPKNSAKSVGVIHNDLGEVTLTDGSSNQYQGYRDHFQIKAGLVVKNPRCIARLANIETSGTTNIFDEDVLISILNAMPMRGAGAFIYCNSTLLTQLDINAKDKTNVNYTTRDVWGVPTMTFRGVPIRKCDAILDTETAIS